MTIRRSTVVTGLALVSVLAVSGASLASAAPTQPQPTTKPSAPTRCPSQAPVPIVVGAYGSGPVLPAGVVSIRICRYGSLDAKQRLEGQHLTRSSALIRSLAKRLNALPGLPPGPNGTACPSDNASEALLFARVKTGAETKVTVGLQGCRSVGSSTGAATRRDLSDSGQQLLAQLVRLAS